MFHCGFSVPRGSGAFRAIDFRATCFLPYISVVVLSPNVTSSLEGIILPGVRVGLSSGAFSESSLSDAMFTSGLVPFFAFLYTVCSVLAPSPDPCPRLLQETGLVA